MTAEQRDGVSAISTSFPDATISDANGQVLKKTNGGSVAGPTTRPDIFIDDPGVVYEGIVYEVNHKVAYTYCSTKTGCTPIVGTINLEVQHTIVDYPSMYLDGFMRVLTGPKVAWTDVRCRTQYEQKVVDKVVFEWGNCRNSQAATPTTLRSIKAQNWIQGGTNYKYYHNDYKFGFKPSGTGNQVTFEWTGPRYQVQPTIGARFR